jgi:hypothetical protein
MKLGEDRLDVFVEDTSKLLRGRRGDESLERV